MNQFDTHPDDPDVSVKVSLNTEVSISSPTELAETMRTMSNLPQMDDLDKDTYLRQAVALDGMQKIVDRAVELANIGLNNEGAFAAGPLNFSYALTAVKIGEDDDV